MIPPRGWLDSFSFSQLFTPQKNHLAVKTERNGAIKKCRYQLVVSEAAPGFVSDHRPPSLLPLHQRFISPKEFMISLPQRANSASCLCLVCFFTGYNKRGGSMPSVRDPPRSHISIAVCLSESHCLMFKRWISLFLSFFKGSSGEWYRPDLLASARATRVSLEGKQHRGPFEREALIIEWNINLSWSSCSCQRHWEVDAPSPPTEALPDEK